MDLDRTIRQALAFPAGARYSEPGRWPILFLQYSLVTGGAGYMIQRLGDGLAATGRYTCDVTGYIGRAGGVAARCGATRCLPNGLYRLLTHARAVGYRYLDAAFPLRGGHCDVIEGLLSVCPGAKLGVRFHSEACFLQHHDSPRARAILRRADCCYAHHARLKADLCELFAPDLSPAKVRVVAPGVDVCRFRPGGSDAGAAREYARRFDLARAGGGKRLVVAMAGRPGEEKNWLDYVAICRRLKDAWGERLACLAVTGPQRGYWRTRHLNEIARFNADLGAPVRITGLVKDWQNILASVDVYVHTACSESFCRTAAEAQACGVPVVATAVGGLAEIVVRHGETGFLVAPERGHRWLARLTQGDQRRFFELTNRLLVQAGSRRPGPWFATWKGAARAHALARMNDRDNTAWHAMHLAGLIS